MRSRLRTEQLRLPPGPRMPRRHRGDPCEHQQGRKIRPGCGHRLMLRRDRPHVLYTEMQHLPDDGTTNSSLPSGSRPGSSRREPPRSLEQECSAPQGGVISPLLANIALHGLEEHLKNGVIQFPIRTSSFALEGEQNAPNERSTERTGGHTVRRRLRPNPREPGSDPLSTRGDPEMTAPSRTHPQPGENTNPTHPKGARG